MGTSATEVERLIQAARLHLAQGELHEAETEATEAIRLDGKEAAAYLVRAEAHRRLKRPERALADLAVAIRLDPHQPGPYVIRAEILKRRNMFDQAIADATYALTIDPRNTAAFSIRAECRNAIGDREGAREDVQEMLLIDPTRPVPALRAGATASAPSSATAAEDERFWKQAGSREDERALFADGKPVDKTYRSRPAVSDEDAPEVLGVASGYKPETIARPLPRVRGRKTIPGGENRTILILGLAVALGCCLWMMLKANSGTEATPNTADLQPLQSAPPGDHEAIPGRRRAESAERQRPIEDGDLGDRPAIRDGRTEAGLAAAVARQARPTASPEIVSLTEINTTKRDFCPWPSPDGLTIYWVTDAPSDPEGEIWTARRKDAGSLFADKRQVGYGRHIAVSADGLTMYLVARRADGRPGASIQVARRPSTDEAFGRPQEVPELRSVDSPRNLFFSADARTLMFCDGPFTPAGFRLMVTTRVSPDARWGRPRPVPVVLGRGVQGLMTGPYLFADGRMLLCALEQPSDRPVGRFMACSRNTPDEPFSRPVFLALPEVEDFFGWMPRYVEATRELFFCSNRLTSAGNLDLWVVRNFEVVAH